MYEQYHSSFRFAFGHGVRVVLPKNALFLGWPNSNMLPTSYKQVPGVKDYEMFISAHTKYSPKLLEPLVPVRLGINESISHCPPTFDRTKDPVWASHTPDLRNEAVRGTPIRVPLELESTSNYILHHFC